MCSTRWAPTVHCSQWIAFNRCCFFGLLLVDNNEDNVGRQIEVHYLTMAGGFNPQGYCHQVRAKIRPGGPPPPETSLSDLSMIKSDLYEICRGHETPRLSPKVSTNAAKDCSLRLPLWICRRLSPSMMMAWGSNPRG